MQTRPVTPRREAAQAGPRADRPGASERRRPTQPAEPASAPPGQEPGFFSLRSWRVRNRLTLLALLPLIAAVGLATARINTLYQERQHFQHAKVQATTAIEVENLLLVLQEERQAASVCLAVVSPCNTAAAAGNAQALALVNSYNAAVQATFQVTNALKPTAVSFINDPSYAANLRADAQETLSRGADLPKIRKVVTTKLAAYSVAYNAYTSVIDDGLSVIEVSSAGTGDSTVSQDNSALTAMDNMIEAESISQLYTVQVIEDQGPLKETALQHQQAAGLNQAIASKTAAVAAFNADANAALAQSFQATVSGPDITQAEAAVSYALRVLQNPANTPVDAKQLDPTVESEALPATIGDMRTVETAAISQMTADSQALLARSQSDLYKSGAVILIALIVSFLGIALVARSLVGPLQVLRAGALDIAANRLPEVVRRLRDADSFDAEAAVEPIPINSNDEIGQVARAFDAVHQQAVRLASEQALLRANVNSMFVNLSRRSQSLVQRQLRLIDELENSEQDPDQLANLFKLDHLATRMRRNGENLLVLAGEEPGRKWSQAVRLLDVMRAGASEVEQYERVALRDLPDVNVLGRVVNDLVHLVAELLENATSFSAPETKVSVTANMLNTGGVMLEIEDAGIGMTPEELDDANERLANPPVIDVAISRRMGLYVVGRLATRHSIQVRLRRSAGGGITALVLVPSTLLAGADGQQQAPTPELSATGARSLGALPRRAGGQLGFPAQAEPAGLLDSLNPRGEGAAAPPYRGAAPAGLTDGDQGDLPPFSGPPARPAPDSLPRRAEPVWDAGGQDRDATASIPGARAPFEDRPAGWPNTNGAQAPGGPSAFGRPGQDPASTGQFPRIQDPSATGQFPRIQDPASTGQFPRTPDPAAGGQGPAQGSGRRDDAPDSFASGPAAGRPAPAQDPASTGQFPRIQDPASTGQFPRIDDPAATGQFPSFVRRELHPDAPAPRPQPVSPPPGATPPADRSFNQPVPPAADPSPAAQGNPPRAADPSAQRPAQSGGALEVRPQAAPVQRQATPVQPPAQPSAVERLFAQDPLPPAPVTDERLPIFEAMESEWFRRRDEARAQAARAQTFAGPAPQAAPHPAPPAPPAARVEPPAPAPQLRPRVTFDEPAPVPAAAPTPVAEPLAAPQRPAPVPAESPDQPLPAATATEPTAANAGGVAPMENTAAWSSPGDDGWKAAQAATKPVAAGLTTKGLPKRVPKSNLVPGSAGGSGAAKATPPAIPPRSADAVRGRLSSFHQGLRQGRDAAQTGEENGTSEPEATDGTGPQ